MSLLTEKSREEVLQELAEALLYYTQSRSKVDFFEIFGPRIFELNDGTILAFLIGPANEEFCFDLAEAETFLDCIREYEQKLEDLPHHGTLFRRAVWIGILEKADFFLG